MEISDDQRSQIPPPAQFAEEGTPWWAPTPEEVAADQALLAEIDAYDNAVASGRIRPRLSRGALLIGLHSQAALEG